MILGFTGTRRGMTPRQMTVIIDLFAMLTPVMFHHGDCIGADAQSHNIASMFSVPIIIHPPDNTSNRAYCQSEQILEPKPYGIRDKDIVNACDILIGCPHDFIEAVRSGTWQTIRYARKIGKPISIVYPDGSIGK